MRPILHFIHIHVNKILQNGNCDDWNSIDKEHKTQQDSPLLYADEQMLTAIPEDELQIAENYLNRITKYVI
jgi:hypothetical protein